MDHKVLIGKIFFLQKLEKYGIQNQYIDCFKSYLNSGKHYVRYSEGTTYSNSNTNELFDNVNKELENIADWYFHE